MPKIANNAGEETRESFITEEMQIHTPMIAVSPTVMVTCGVNRKVNTGNYENIDIYAAVTLPVPEAHIGNLEELKQWIVDVTEIGFGLASKETGERYLLIKKALREGRQDEETPA